MFSLLLKHYFVHGQWSNMRVITSWNEWSLQFFRWNILRFLFLVFRIRFQYPLPAVSPSRMTSLVINSLSDACHLCLLIKQRFKIELPTFCARMLLLLLDLFEFLYFFLILNHICDCYCLLSSDMLFLVVCLLFLFMSRLFRFLFWFVHRTHGHLGYLKTDFINTVILYFWNVSLRRLRRFHQVLLIQTPLQFHTFTVWIAFWVVAERHVSQFDWILNLTVSFL